MWSLFRHVGVSRVQHDPNWKNLSKGRPSNVPLFDDKSHADGMSQSGRRKYPDYDSEIMSEHYSTTKGQKRKTEGKNALKLKQIPGMNATEQSKSRIDESEYSFETEQRHKRKKYYDKDDNSFLENESQLNIVAEEDYEGMDWKDCCLKVLDRIEEYEEADDFRKPLTKEELGEFWDEYRAIISYPIDLTSIRAKIYEGEFAGVGNFEFDMRKVFDNCKKFNDPNSGIYENANMLEEVFNKLFRPVKKRFGENKKLKEAGINLSIGGIGI